MNVLALSTPQHMCWVLVPMQLGGALCVNHVLCFDKDKGPNDLEGAFKDELPGACP